MADDSPDVTPEPEEPQPLCPNCMAAPEPGTHVCKECGAPLDLFATTDPLETIRTQGWAYRRVTSGHGTRMAVLGMRVLFGTLILSGLLTLLFVFDYAQDPLKAAVAAALGLPLMAVYVLILRKCKTRPRDDLMDHTDDPPTAR